MSNAHDGGKGAKRSLPSWMSSRDSGEKSRRKKNPTDGGELDEENDSAKNEQAASQSSAHNGTATPTKETKNSKQSVSRGKGKASSGDTSSFAKLLDGVIFVLSGFVNPERSTLRSQAQEMGAEYQPDWNSNCTLLVCAFPNTPKFRQVEADCGTIVSKEWISECYSQKKLVAIETYLMHAGKPWRKSSVSQEACHEEETSLPERPHKRVERSSPSKSTVASSSSAKGGAPTRTKECFSPTAVKKWAINDLSETISWLESQEESPEPGEIKKIAAEGILTCLQDAIESLEKNQEIGRAIEQWKYIPRVVKELAKLEEVKSGKRSDAEKDIHEQALTCRHIYEKEFENLDDNPTVKKRRPTAGKGDEGIKKVDTKSTDAGYDSDETIEMTEDEIDLAYKSISSKLGKW